GLGRGCSERPPDGGGSPRDASAADYEAFSPQARCETSRSRERTRGRKGQGPVRSLLVVPLVLLAVTASAAGLPAALPEPNEALLFALGLIGLGAGLSRPPQ